MPHGTMRIGAIVAALAVITACDDDTYTTTADQIELTSSDLRVGLHRPFNNSTPLLEGTHVCFTCESTLAASDDTGDVGTHPLLSCGDGYTNSDILTCFEQDFFRGRIDDDGCFTLDGPDQAAWLLNPVPCTVTDFWGFTAKPDSLQFTLSPRDAVYATFEQWPEDAAFALHEQGNLVRSGGGAFPPELKNPVFEPFRVLAGQEFAFTPQLWDEKRDTPIAFNVAESRIDVIHLAGPEPIITEGPERGLIRVRPFANTRVQVFLTVQGTYTYLVGDIVGVPIETLSSMELVVAMEDLRATDDWGPPVAARAVVRDAAGHLVYGVPVEWGLKKGSLSLGGAGDIVFPGLDYLQLADTCYQPDQFTIARSAILTAEFGDLDAETELIWTPYIDGDHAYNLQNCETACSGCATGPASGGAIAGLLGALSLLRRRRR